MPGEFCARLFSRLHAHARLVPFFGVALILLCAVPASHLVMMEDVTALLPEKPDRLQHHYRLLSEAPFAQYMTVTVGTPGSSPAPAAKALAEALAKSPTRIQGGPLTAEIIATAGPAFSPNLLPRLSDYVPGLMEEAEWAELPNLVLPEAVDAALREDARLLLSPRGLALRGLLAKDPLGLTGKVLARIGLQTSSGNMRVENGLMLDPRGEYALLLIKPALPMNFSAEAQVFMDALDEAAANLPEGTEVISTGGHRHSAANASVIKGDLVRVLPVSLALLALLFAALLRDWRGLFIFLVPPASLVVATAFTGLTHGAVSGIVIGFGSVLLGITADYAIHVYFALRHAPRPGRALASVTGPMLLAAATTMAAFLAFMVSSIPTIRQISTFATGGLLTALFFSLVILPHCPGIAPHQKAENEKEFPGAPADSAKRLFLRRKLLLGLLWLVLLACLPAMALTLPIDGDIRALSYIPEEILRDEERTRDIWGNMQGGAMVVVEATQDGQRQADAAMPSAMEDLMEEALTANLRIRDILTGPGGLPPGEVTSLAPLLPPASFQRENHHKWSAFWEQHQQSTLSTIEAASPAHGFSPEAFAPFAAWTSAPPPLLRPEILADFGVGMQANLLLQRKADAVALYTLITGHEALPEALEKQIRSAGGELVSGAVFREDLADATRRDLVLFCSMALAVLIGAVLVAFRSPARAALVLLPVFSALCLVLFAFHALDVQINIFHAVALPLVMALSIDYGIFMLSSLEGSLDKTSRKAILLSALTTISGFGSLILARHPALFSLGLTVAAGIGAAMVTALFVLPYFAKPVTGPVTEDIMP